MKLLHTSDWHIGQRLYGKDRHDEHIYFFDWLVQTIEQNQVEALLVSGDVFDVAYPPNHALSLYYATLLRIYKSGCKIIITGGNHDAVSTLHAPKELLAHISVFVNASAPSNLHDCIVELKDNDQLVAVVAAVPFLRDHEIRQAVAGQSHADKQQALRDGIKNYYQQIADHIQATYAGAVPVIGMGHLALGGASASDSEREIHIGGLEQLRHDQLPTAFDYWALGHIHRPQVIAGNPQIRYSGSPLRLSFSERNNKNQVLLLDTADKFTTPHLIEVPQYRQLLRFTGTLAEVKEALTQHKATTTDWVELLIREENYLPHLNSELEELVTQVREQNNCEVLKYRVDYAERLTPNEELYPVQNLNEMTPKQVFSNYLATQGIEEVQELEETFTELLDVLNQKN